VESVFPGDTRDPCVTQALCVGHKYRREAVGARGPLVWRLLRCDLSNVSPSFCAWRHTSGLFCVAMARRGSHASLQDVVLPHCRGSPVTADNCSRLAHICDGAPRRSPCSSAPGRGHRCRPSGVKSTLPSRELAATGTASDGYARVAAGAEEKISCTPHYSQPILRTTWAPRNRGV